MKSFIGFLILTLTVFQSIFSQTTVNLDLQKNSYLSINGTTNLLSFNLHQDGNKFVKNNLTFIASQNQNKLFLSQNQLAIEVKNFTSDNIMVLKDFQKLLKSDIYPSMQVQLNYIELLPNTSQSKIVKGNALVNITITGVTKKFTIPISSNSEGDIFIVDGKKDINIRDFGLTPPEEMLGLLKVSEWINIDFHLNCKISVQKPLLEANTEANETNSRKSTLGYYIK